MHRVALGVLAVLLCVPALRALEDPKDKPKAEKPGTPAEQEQALEKEFSQAQQEFFKVYGQAKTDQERQDLVAKKYPKPQEYAPRFLELAEKHPKDPAAIKALVWVTRYARIGPQGNKALEILLRDHIESKELTPVCQSMMYSAGPQGEKFLRAVLEKNSHRDVKGWATFSLAQQVKNRDAKEAEPLYETVAKDYGNVKAYGDVTLGKLAEGALFEMRNLAIGKKAPEIEGEDIDGKKFKLSDYKGKVVVLDFWGNW
jgi:hypothetical protein